jgi:hypothetical protein
MNYLGVWLWLWLLFKVLFHAKMYQNDVFFLFLRSAHQKIPKKLIFSKKNLKF